MPPRSIRKLLVEEAAGGVAPFGSVPLGFEIGGGVRRRLLVDAAASSSPAATAMSGGDSKRRRASARALWSS